jgi:hypothetical protein
LSFEKAHQKDSFHGVQVAHGIILSSQLCLFENNGHQAQNVPVINFLFTVDPKSGELGEHVYHFECLKVVDEDVWHPQVVDELQVDWNKKEEKKWISVVEQQV